jgi:RNA polymerase sigma-70 factor, ECF subfamily
VPNGEDSTSASRASSDVSLVLDAQAGSIRAKEMLLDRHLDRTRRFAWRLLGPDQDLNDVVQECMVSALESFSRLKNPRFFSTWLGGVLLNTVRRTLRRRRCSNRLEVAAIEPMSIETVPAKGLMPDQVAEVAQGLHALQQLPEAQCTAWLLRYVEGNSVPEIARMLCCSTTTVKRWLQAAQSSLAKRQRCDQARFRTRSSSPRRHR